jgi:hypothetical protein
MKISVSLLIVFLFLIACNNKKEKKDTPAIKIPAIDSSSMVRPERTVNPYVPVDVSPMDMSYYPADYPKLKMTNSGIKPPYARVVYSRPHLQGRSLFKDVLKYGEPWRLGANEATELDLYTDATIQGKKIKAGRYILYCIPEKDSWAISFNSNIDSWGLHPDESKDIARFVVPSKQANNSVEFFTMAFEKTNGIIELVMAWDNVEARLPFIF